MATGSEVIPGGAALIAQAVAISEHFEGLACSFQTDEVDEFRFKVETLQLKYEFWITQLQSCDISAEGLDIGKTVVEALGILEAEEPRFRKLSYCKSCVVKYSTWKIDFPVHLTTAVQKVIDAFDSIPLALKEKGGIIPGHLPHVVSKPRAPKLPFTIEQRYVPLKRTATKIQRALENERGPQVVVLHGSPGTGKSSLARYIALHYQDALGGDDRMDCMWEEHRDSTLCSATPNIHSDKSERVPGRFADGIFYVPCGQQGPDNIVAVQLHLLQDLGFMPPIGKLSHLSLDEIHSRLQKKIWEYLVKRVALVVLDNVWDPNLVKWLLIRGSKVKYLVTTQDPSLWEDSESISIPIEKVGLENARNILASQTTMDNSELKNIFDGIITLTESNPSALVNVSMAILRRNDLDEWKDIKDNIEGLLIENSPEENSAAFPHDMPKPVACSMILALDSLPLGVEKLLVALAALEGPTVPQIVVQLLVKSNQGSLASFSRCRNFLEDRALIRLQREKVCWSTQLQTTWFIDPLQQSFIQHRKVKSVTTLVANLLNRATVDDSTEISHSDYNLSVALCAVYGTRKVAVKAAIKLGIFYLSNDMTRIWAAPIVSMFHATEEDKLKHEVHCFARQVFLAYVCSKNPGRGMTGLLELPATAPPTCWAIAWAIPNPKRALLARSEETLQGLIRCLGEDVDETVGPNLQRYAIAALWNLAMAAETKVYVAHAPGLLEMVIHLLESGAREDVQRHAAGIMASLSSEKDNQLDLAVFPRLIRNLVELLRDDVSSKVQIYAAHALMHLASAWPNKVLIATFPGCLLGLVKLMGGHKTIGVHEIAVGALLNLSTSLENKALITKFPGALDGLIGLLADSASVVVQKRAAAALINLTTNRYVPIRTFPGVLEKLVGLLSKGVHHELQEVAAKVLGNLAIAEDNSATIAAFPGAWRGLVRLLNEDVILPVQVQAANTIGLLAAGGQAKVPTTGVAIAIEGLLGLLAENINIGVLEKVMMAILRITDVGDSKNFVAIANFPSSLGQLVHLLNQEEYPEIQATAALVMATLAKWKANRVPIGHFPGALGGLLALLANGVDPSVQLVALKTLWHVAYDEDLNCKAIAKLPGALDSIVALLDKDGLADIQHCAALLLSALAGVQGHYMHHEIPGALQKLTMLLAEDVSSGVQQEAAKAITLLDWETGNRLRLGSSDAYAGRGRANTQLGMLHQALADFDMAIQLMWDLAFSVQTEGLDEDVKLADWSPPGDDPNSESEIMRKKIAHVLSDRAFVKAMLKDYNGAVSDADSALELQPRAHLLWQERGILKRLMGDLPGALADLDTSLQMVPDDYESLKHCGLVHFLMEDLEAACTTAERAILIDEQDQSYDPPDGDECRLGKLSVAYLDYKLA